MCVCAWLCVGYNTCSYIHVICIVCAEAAGGINTQSSRSLLKLKNRKQSDPKKITGNSCSWHPDWLTAVL